MFPRYQIASMDFDYYKFEKLCKTYCWLVPVFLAFFFAWHTQSFTLSECASALSAHAESLSEFRAQISAYGLSHSLFYHGYLFIWSGLTCCDSELVLRLSNLLWVVLAAWFFRKDSRALFVLLLSPYFIYYTNDLSPCLMQMAVACGITYFLYSKSLSKPQSTSRGLGLLFVLCLTGLSGCIWAIGFFVAWLVLEGREFWSVWSIRSRICWGVAFLGIFGFYVATYSPTSFPQPTTSGLLGLLSSGYEMLGLLGLGPNKGDWLYYSSIGDIFTNSNFFLALFGALVVMGLLVHGLIVWRQRTSSHSFFPSLACLVCLPLALQSLFSMYLGYSLFPEFSAPLLPLVCLIIARGLPWEKDLSWKNIITSTFVIIWLLSDVCIRFDDNYARPDYRGAIDYAKQEAAKGYTVLLLCHPWAKSYYDPENSLPPQKWHRCQKIITSDAACFVPIIEQVKNSGRYQRKRQLCPSFYEYALKSSLTITPNDGDTPPRQYFFERL